MNDSTAAHRLREQLKRFVGTVFPHVPKLQREFLGQMFFGIQAGQTTVLGRIARELDECSFLPAAEALAAIVKTPVVLVGGVRSLETANAVLAKTAIQYIALSRPFIREPNLINRWQSGDIRPSTCVSCNACYRTSAHACLFTASH